MHPADKKVGCHPLDHSMRLASGLSGETITFLSYA